MAIADFDRMKTAMPTRTTTRTRARARRNHRRLPGVPAHRTNSPCHRTLVVHLEPLWTWRARILEDDAVCRKIKVKAHGPMLDPAEWDPSDPWYLGILDIFGSWGLVETFWTRVISGAPLWLEEPTHSLSKLQCKPPMEEIPPNIFSHEHLSFCFINLGFAVQEKKESTPHTHTNLQTCPCHAPYSPSTSWGTLG